MGVGDPQHSRSVSPVRSLEQGPGLGAGLEPRLAPRLRTLQGERRSHRLTPPTGQSPPVVGEARLRQLAAAESRSITGRPGEQFGSAVARQHPGRIELVQHRDRPAQIGVLAIRVGPQRGLTQHPPQRRRWPERHQRGAGIQQLLRAAAKACRRRRQVASVALTTAGGGGAH